MAGPVQPYLTTQLAAQNAFNIPFGLLTTVNNAINTAVSAGEFNVTINLDLFAVEDVANLRIYLESLGYSVDFSRHEEGSGVVINWQQFLAIPGSSTTVIQGTTPWIIAGAVDQGTPNTNNNAWPVYIQKAASANVAAINVTTSSTILLPANSARKGFTVQCKTAPIYITLGTISSSSLYSCYLLKLNEYERSNYTGAVSAILDLGSADVLVTELV